MHHELTISQIDDLSVEFIEELSTLLIDVVQDGASIGFLPPLEHEVASRYWYQVLSPEVLLWVVRWKGEVVGSVQLHLCTKQNGQHRAEIAKLMVHPSARRLGIGRALMEVAEKKAVDEKRTLLVLDTREGDPSNQLYLSLGYQVAGRIPQYAQSADGRLDGTVFYYKQL
ncbi:GNAT family N-acetyltransferase [Brevibacillus sp. SYSU BS000544]|uniref:GNAT family N-acetyltransferase n=1 Tax=Brevibacillus sp. SYSU BS000544 TaxID=3416443 RepID=UPI003CE54A49